MNVPSELGDELVAEGYATRSRQLRGGTAEIVQFAVDAINVGGATVTIVLGVAAATRLVTGVLRRGRTGNTDRVTISVTRGSVSESITVDPEDVDAHERTLDLIISIFDSD